MKYIHYVIVFASILLFSCQDENSSDSIGYLRMNIGVVIATAPQTKAVPENYNPMQLQVQIINSSGEVVEKTDDYTQWKDETFTLPTGVYTIQASSYGFDGMESGEDIPYYSGSTQVTIQKETKSTANLTCTLANVKVTVNFDEAFSNIATVVTIRSTTIAGIGVCKFTPDRENKPVYFPVGDLEAGISVFTQKGMKEETVLIKDVKAREHYILNYKVADKGNGNITVTADDDVKTYTFSFPVTTEVTTSLAIRDVNAWSNFAYVTGYISSTEDDKTLNPANMRFEYKKNTATTWTSIAATEEGENFKATLTALTPNTQYMCRLVYRTDDEEYLSNEQKFTTEEAIVLPNGGFEDWFLRENKNTYLTITTNTWIPSTEQYYNENGLFWDSSNPGTTTNMGALANINPTEPTTENVHGGSKAAVLKSQYKVKFAAASLYTGEFGELIGTNGAKVNFGQPFTSRPTKLHGYFQYSTAAMDRVDKIPAGVNIVKNQTLDLCSIYFALTTKVFQVDNTDISTLDWSSQPEVIAYGELPASEAVTTNGWKEFTIELKYRDLTTKPTHIIILCSSSKYGDYFTGSTSSVLYLDDFELIYGEPVTDPDYIK